jgi:hypothetical protein
MENIVSMLSFLLVAALGCIPEDDRFNYNGDNDNWEDGNNNNNNNNTTDEFAVASVEAGFYDCPNLGVPTCIALAATPINVNLADLDGGAMKVSADSEVVQFEGSDWLPIDGTVAWVTVEDTVFTLLAPPEKANYELVVTLKTAGGGLSESSSTTVEADWDGNLPDAAE